MYKPLKYILISIFTLTLFIAVVDGVAGTAIAMILLIWLVIYIDKDKKMKKKANSNFKHEIKKKTMKENVGSEKTLKDKSLRFIRWAIIIIALASYTGTFLYLSDGYPLDKNVAFETAFFSILLIIAVYFEIKAIKDKRKQ